MGTFKEALEGLNSFILEALTILSDDLDFDFNIQNYDTDNIASIGMAQQKQMITVEHIEKLAQKVTAKRTEFKELEIRIDNFFNGFHSLFLENYPRERGYPQELYLHKVKSAFLAQEGFDLDEVKILGLRFSGLKERLEAREKRIEKVYWELKALQDKNKQILQSQPRTPWGPVDGISATQTPMPKAMSPSVPAPAMNHPALPKFSV